MIRRSNLAKDHDRYGELSTLVLIGQASPTEYREWEAHVASCPFCRAEYRDFTKILFTELPLVNHLNTSSVNLDEETFETAASADGEEVMPQISPPSSFEQAPQPKPKWWKQLQPAWISYALGLALAVTVALLSWQLHHDAKHNQAQINEIAGLRKQVSAFSQRNQKSLERALEPTVNVQAQSAQSKQEATGAEYAKLQIRNRFLNANIKRAGEEINSLRAELEVYRNIETQLSSRASEAEQSLVQLKTELQAVTQAKNISEDKLRDHEARLQTAAYEVDELRDGIERDRKLLAADRDIRDLMGARNLRIVDVFDVDGKGRTKKPFGRVFFTEGKSLIFYAFDLGQDRAVMRSASFQAWGTQGPSQPKARSLGIFYRDDQTANRWILKFDDPKVLAEIDSVFVTVEPSGGSNKPTGATLLSAYLKANLNHP